MTTIEKPNSSAAILVVVWKPRGRLIGTSMKY
jgi:hypothetical protein